MNKFIARVFEKFNNHGIIYCHWKSNNNLAEALDGADDLDILVAPESVSGLSEVLSDMGFRLASDTGKTSNPFVYHFYAMDPDTGLLIHFHVYYRLVTGGSILKNYWIPVERMLFSEINRDMAIPTPSKEADLILFVIRKLIEQTTIIEHFLFYRDYHNIKRELSWLSDGCDSQNIDKLLRMWLPSFEPVLFHRCLTALESDAGVIKRFVLGYKVRCHFKFTVLPPLWSSVIRGIVFFKTYIKGKLRIQKKDRILFPGGRLIAFVGSEASGKSTLSKETALWFSNFCDVLHVHLGKPPKSYYTVGPYLAIKCYSIIKKILQRFKGIRISSNESSDPQDYEPHPIVAVLDAIDRYCLARRCFRKVMQGTIVVTDRYPLRHRGGLDSARIVPKGIFTSFLARVEQHIYLRIPSPDLVFKVVAPLDVTLKRNTERSSPEPEGFVRFRYMKAKEICFDETKMIEVDATKSLEETVRFVRWVAWTSGGF